VVRSLVVAVVAAAAASLCVAGCATQSARLTASSDRSQAPGNASPASRPKPSYSPPPSAPAKVAAARPCRSAQLGLTYIGGGLATGKDFGSVAIWNTGDAGCLLQGAVTATPLDRRGRQIRGRPWTSTARAHGVYLSPRGVVTTGAQRPPAGDSWVALILSGNERADPSQPNGLCRPADEITPHYWRITVVGHPYLVRNLARDGADVPRLYGCHAEFDNVSLAIQP
jgi:hypothetical protein